MEGTVFKLGGFTKNSFQKRHFILNDSRLSWYKKQGDSKPQGSFSVRGAMVTKFSGLKHGKQHVFAIQPGTGKSLKDDKSYVLAAVSASARDQWIEKMQDGQGTEKMTVREVGGGAKSTPTGKAGGQKQSKGECTRCHKDLASKVVKVNDTMKYHRDCFNCNLCAADLITGYQLHDEEIHCVKCKTKLTEQAMEKQQKTAKASGGGGGATKKKYGGAKPKWPECFRCGGPCTPGYLVHGKNYCDECHVQFDKHGACEICGELCDGDYIKVSFDKRYHPKCFNCEGCERELAGIAYKYKKNKIWCIECAPLEERIMYKEKKKGL